MAVLDPFSVTERSLLGYHTPQNLQHYAIYLDCRIRAYKELKHDTIHVQSESNRDMRNSHSIEEDANRGPRSASNKNKGTSERKLRVMTVEKGLLRETKVVQRMIDALVECRVNDDCSGHLLATLISSSIQFYLDDLEDTLTTTALIMLVKDLLILFQAGNEGVINVLGIPPVVFYRKTYPYRQQSITLKCPTLMRRMPSPSTGGSANKLS